MCRCGTAPVWVRGALYDMNYNVAGVEQRWYCLGTHCRIYIIMLPVWRTAGTKDSLNDAGYIVIYRNNCAGAGASIIHSYYDCPQEMPLVLNV